MIRYCSNCQKEYDFQVKRMSDLDNLVCPACGKIIPKDSKKPVSGNPEGVADAIGTVYYVFARIAWVILLIMGCAGVICYFLHMSTALYIITAVSLLYYFSRYGFLRELGIVWIPVAAVLGFVFFKTPSGIALAINLAMILRHIIRNIIWTLISKLINFVTK